MVASSTRASGASGDVATSASDLVGRAFFGFFGLSQLAPVSRPPDRLAARPSSTGSRCIAMSNSAICRASSPRRGRATRGPGQQQGWRHRAPRQGRRGR